MHEQVGQLLKQVTRRNSARGVCALHTCSSNMSLGVSFVTPGPNYSHSELALKELTKAVLRKH